MFHQCKCKLHSDYKTHPHFPPKFGNFPKNTVISAGRGKQSNKKDSLRKVPIFSLTGHTLTKLSNSCCGGKIFSLGCQQVLILPPTIFPGYILKIPMWYHYFSSYLNGWRNAGSILHPLLSGWMRSFWFSNQAMNSGRGALPFPKITYLERNFPKLMNFELSFE